MGADAHGSGRAAASWVLAVLAAVALATAGILWYAERTTFRSDAFADRVGAALERPAGQAAIARRLADAAIGVRPDLVTVRPLVVLAAERVVDTAAFRALLRRAVLEAHRSAFRGSLSRPVLRVRDAGLLLAEAMRVIRPDLARRVPTTLPVPLVRVADVVDRFLVGLAQRADQARRWAPVAAAAAVLLALAALGTAGSRRAAALRLGVAAAAVGGLLAVGALLAPGAAARSAGGLDEAVVRDVVRIWLEPVAVWSLAAGVAGAAVALAAASVVRRVAVPPLLRRVGRTLATWPPGDAGRATRAAVVLGAGVLMVASPRTVLVVLVTVLGLLLALAAATELLSLAAGPPDTVAPSRGRGRRRTLRLAGAALALAVPGAVAAVAVGGGAPEEPQAITGRCNGQAVLCGRRLDEVAFLGTHNSMAAVRAPSWLFPAQDAGIPEQLEEGVRALLIDTHHGFRTPRGVLTDLSGETKSRGKLVDEVGETFVRTAERARDRIGTSVAGRRRGVFLCHAFCEVGATDAVSALRAVHRFLVLHPEEVLVLSVEDDTDPAATAAIIRRSGLVDEVYRGRAGPPWPTLGEMIERDERVLVLVEDGPPTEPWIHLQPAVAQETPYRFTTEAQLAALASCDPNRGGTEGSLLLVNHWVDTTPAPRVTIAERVNARPFLERRLERCATRRPKRPNVLAVDFYRLGDAQAVVDRLNGR